MAIIVEDGSGVLNANSYVTEAELTAYATARGITLVADEEQLLIKAMDYIEGFDFIGLKKEEDQSLQWPRLDVWIDDYYWDSDEIPKELKNAEMEAAIAIDQSNDPLANIDREEKSVTVGEISVTYMDRAASETIVRRISNQLRKLIKRGFGTSFKTYV